MGPQFLCSAMCGNDIENASKMELPDLEQSGIPEPVLVLEPSYT